MSVYDRWHKKERQLDGSIKKVPSAEYGKGMRWQVRWVDENGKSQKLNFNDHRQAKNKDAEITNDLAKQKYIPRDKAETTFQEYASRFWLPSRSANQQTVDGYERILRLHAFPVIGGCLLGDLASTPSLIQSWISQMEGESSSVRKYLGTVSTIFESAIEDGFIRRNPCKSRSLSLPGGDRRQVVPLTEEQARRLVDSLGWLAVVGIATGLRQGEIFGLDPDDIDRRKRVLNVYRQVKITRNTLCYGLPKGRKTRSVPLPDFVIDAIDMQAEVSKPAEVTLPWEKPGGQPTTQRLIFHDRGEVHKRWNFNRDIWKPALEKAGIPTTRRYGVHVLRHTYASTLLNKGIDVRTLASFLGHEDPAFTLRVYTHFLPTSAETARIALESVYKIRAISGHSN